MAEQIVCEEANSFLPAGSQRIFTIEDNPGDLRVLKRNSASAPKVRRDVTAIYTGFKSYKSRSVSKLKYTIKWIYRCIFRSVSDDSGWILKRNLCFRNIHAMHELKPCKSNYRKSRVLSTRAYVTDLHEMLHTSITQYLIYTILQVTT